MHRAVVALAACAMLLSSCASVPRDTSFTLDAENALLVIVAPTGGSNNLDVFRQVDLASGQFVAAPIVISVNTYGGLDHMFSARNQINSDRDNRVVALAIRQVPPGDYARVESTRTVGSMNWGAVGVLCLNELSPVYSLAAGEIVIVRVDDVVMRQTSFGTATLARTATPVGVADESIIQEFERARRNYPNIQGVATMRAPMNFVTWPQTNAGLLETMNRNCAEPNSFSQADGAK